MAEHGLTDAGRLGGGLGYTVTRRGFYRMQAAGRSADYETAEEARAAYLSVCAEILAERAAAKA
ncbi:hypothetical protein D3C71_2203870 [compost metagenome]